MTHSGFAGIDGGGTKTTVVLVDASGTELTRVQTTTSNAAVVGHDAAGETLRTALEAAIRQTHQPITITKAWFGLSGSDRPLDHSLLRPYVETLAPRIRMTNDAELILGALPDSVGVAIVSGTGSIAVGRNTAGERVRSGGWGQIIGDEGSGYDLARRMFEAFAAETDGRGPATSLTQRLTQHLSLAEPHQLIAFVYRPGTTKADLASLSHIVVEEADRGDVVAADILLTSGAQLAATTRAAARRLGFVHRLPLAVTGGLIANVEPFRTAVIETLRRDWPEIDCHVVTDPALTAARFLASEAHQP